MKLEQSARKALTIEGWKGMRDMVKDIFAICLMSIMVVVESSMAMFPIDGDR